MHCIHTPRARAVFMKQLQIPSRINRIHFWNIFVIIEHVFLVTEWRYIYSTENATVVWLTGVFADGMYEINRLSLMCSWTQYEPNLLNLSKPTILFVSFVAFSSACLVFWSNPHPCNSTVATETSEFDSSAYVSSVCGTHFFVAMYTSILLFSLTSETLLSSPCWVLYCVLLVWDYRDDAHLEVRVWGIGLKGDCNLKYRVIE